MTAIPVKEAKNTFTQILRMVEGGEPVQIERHGKSVAVISSLDFFNQLSQISDFEKDLNTWRAKAAQILTNDEIEDIFKTERKIEHLSRADDLLNAVDRWKENSNNGRSKGNGKI